MKLNAAALPARARLTWDQTFAALHYPNYRLWFLGQLVSLMGTWMQNTAQGYLVYELTRSPVFLGYVGFAAGVPSWLFMLYGGVVADRISRRVLLIITQTAMMVLAFILAALVFTGLVQPWHIILLAFMLGIANAFDAPARQAFVVELIPRENLTNAIALNSTMFNAATVVGPSIAGLTYAAFGPAWCFIINGLTFIAVIAALSLMRLQALPPRAIKASALSELVDGLRYVSSHNTIRMLIGNMGVISLLGLGMITLLPAWAVDVLGGDVKTNGLLLSARGAGALIGALMIASLGSRKVRGKLWTIGSFILPALTLGFAMARWLPLSLVLMIGMGWGFMTLANTSNALVQTQVPDQLRGRVMSLFALVFLGFMPIGSLLAGALASRFGEQPTVMFSALVLMAFALFVWLRLPQLRKLD